MKGLRSIRKGDNKKKPRYFLMTKTVMQGKGKMKKILFVIHELSIGGIQQSLLNLISEIKEQYKITMMIFHLREDDEKRIPDGIRVITVSSPFKHLGISMTEAKQSPFLFISHSFWQALTKSFGRSKTIRLMCLFQKKLDGFGEIFRIRERSGQP